MCRALPSSTISVSWIFSLLCRMIFFAMPANSFFMRSVSRILDMAVLMGLSTHVQSCAASMNTAVAGLELLVNESQSTSNGTAAISAAMSRANAGTCFSCKSLRRRLSSSFSGPVGAAPIAAGAISAGSMAPESEGSAASGLAKSASILSTTTAKSLNGALVMSSVAVSWI
eukprot:Mycagemm_TRINITY_DN10321_c5_g3::TRINITY_DN10321_c5_g3_i1::g.761::m.761 type:complete len:171 gc:universal TRINITY_DN10321_c5_g3_i1:169-681(+)